MNLLKTKSEIDYFGFEYLDKILLTLYNAKSQGLHLDGLKSEVHLTDSDKAKNIKRVMIFDDAFTFEKALAFLESEDCITISDSRNIDLVYPGILKLSLGGYAGMAKRSDRAEKLNNTYLKWTVIFAAAVFIVSLLSLIVNFLDLKY